VRGTGIKEDIEQALAKPATDLLAGLTVAIVALPLALAFGIASGLGPQAGITTAIVAGALAAIFGGSRFQVSGPTGAMTVVLIPIYRDHGADGVLLTGLLAGIILILAAAAKLGSLVQRLPIALIEGFTAGIAVVIALAQFEFIPDLMAFGCALSVCVLMLAGARVWPKLPIGLVLVTVWAIIATWLNLPLDRIGELPAQIGVLSFSFLEQNWLPLVFPAFAVALLAGLESLLSAKIADQMKPGLPPHQSNRELFGQGVANLAVPFLGGVPATAALARTAVNVNSGANSKLAAVSHSLILAILVLLFAPLVETLPLAALAGVLIATAVRMVRFADLKELLFESKTSAAVLLVTFVVTVAVDLTTALATGLIMHGLLAHTKFGRLLGARINQSRIDPD
jgi:SulP family sulfate permease